MDTKEEKALLTFKTSKLLLPLQRLRFGKGSAFLSLQGVGERKQGSRHASKRAFRLVTTSHSCRHSIQSKWLRKHLAGRLLAYPPGGQFRPAECGQVARHLGPGLQPTQEAIIHLKGRLSPPHSGSGFAPMQMQCLARQPASGESFDGIL